MEWTITLEQKTGTIWAAHVQVVIGGDTDPITIFSVYNIPADALNHPTRESVQRRVMHMFRDIALSGRAVDFRSGDIMEVPF